VSPLRLPPSPPHLSHRRLSRNFLHCIHFLGTLCCGHASHSVCAPARPSHKPTALVVVLQDNLFASLLMGLGNRSWAYSNLFVVMKSKTAAGFIPNYAAGGMRSEDRTEPPVGAKVLLELYRKYNDKWVGTSPPVCLSCCLSVLLVNH